MTLICVYKQLQGYFLSLWDNSVISAVKNICDPASQNQQKVAWPSFVLWLEIGDQGQHG